MNPDTFTLAPAPESTPVAAAPEDRRVAGLTPCRHCGKPYKNVKEHITKSHSWIQLTSKDGEIEELELYWKGMMWKGVYGEGWRWDVAKRENLIMSALYPDPPEASEDWLWICVEPTEINPAGWVVKEIELHKNNNDIHNCKTFTWLPIQVRHRRV
jgi:hypothetical protein